MLCRHCQQELPPHLIWEGIHDECLIEEKKQNKDILTEDEQREIKQQLILDKASHIKLTTAFSFANEEVETELEIITAECVFGMNVFRDFFAGMTDFFGGRSEASQKVLRDARRNCLQELRLEAIDIGADGVLAVDLDHSEISGKGKGMLFLVASGTAVKFKK